MHVPSTGFFSSWQVSPLPILSSQHGFLAEQSLGFPSLSSRQGFVPEQSPGFPPRIPLTSSLPVPGTLHMPSARDPVASLWERCGRGLRDQAIVELHEDEDFQKLAVRPGMEDIINELRVSGEAVQKCAPPRGPSLCGFL